MEITSNGKIKRTIKICGVSITLALLGEFFFVGGLCGESWWKGQDENDDIIEGLWSKCIEPITGGYSVCMYRDSVLTFDTSGYDSGGKCCIILYYVTS